VSFDEDLGLLDFVYRVVLVVSSWGHAAGYQPRPQVVDSRDR